MLQEGDALIYPGTGPELNPGASHICVVVKIDEQAGDVYLVPISSELANLDSVCRIGPDEGWAAIRKPSFAAYYNAKKSALKGVLDQIESKKIKNTGQVPNFIFKRIKTGISLSENTEPFFEKAFAPVDLRRATPRVILESAAKK